jgi:bifunctional DNase/RNase
MAEENEEESREEGDLPPSFFPFDADEDLIQEPFDLGEPVEVSVEGVFFAETGSNVSRFVLLTDGERKLPIVIGAPEAVSISIPLEGSQTDRPLTHDLLKSILEKLGGHITKIVIDDIWNKTYYAKIFIQHGKTLLEVDSRPSDAIALALRCEVPIYVRDGILDQTDD